MTKILGAPTLDDALKALGGEVAEHEKRGERTLVFCEDRLTLLAERAVLKEVGGTFLAEVTTFARFLKGEERVLSKHGSVLEISALLSAHKGELKCFGENAAQAVYETIAQLSASRVSPAMLRASAEETQGVLCYKLFDLALIFEEYQKFLRAHALLDENGYLALLPEKIASDVAEGTHVVFFAFRSFTRQALEGVRAAISRGLRVTGIFLAGRENFYTNEAAAAFARVAEEGGKAEKLQLASSLSGEAALLRDALFSHDSTGDAADAEKVFTFFAQDETEEIATVAALIRRKVAEGARYRDMALLVGSERYFLPVLKAFESYHIPFYADRKRKFSEHPFCTFALDVLAAVSGGPAPDEADDVASSVYFGDDGTYRNYLAKFGGYRGAARRPLKEAALKGADAKKLEKARGKMCAVLDLFKREDTAAGFAEGLRKLRALVKEEKVTEEIAKTASPEERNFLNTARFEEVLRETEEIAGEKKYTARAFAVLLRSGLEALEISMFPRRSDAVFVGDITESRLCRAPYLFCAGLTDDLPIVTQDTAVITDGEIEKLKTLKVEIEPAIAVVNARSRESLALNLLSFSGELYLSCPASEGDEETVPSEIFSYVKEVLHPRKVGPLFPFDCCEEEPALLAYFAACDRARGGQKEKESVRPYLALKEVFEGGYFRHGMPIYPDGLRFQTEKGDVEEAAKLYFSGEISPTLLEDYFACPYKSFAERALRLEEREETRSVLDSGDAGTFVHAVLERVAKKFNEFENAESCAAFAREQAEELLRTPRFAALGDTKAGGYTAVRLEKEATSVACAAYRQLAGSNFSVKAAEAEVRLPRLSLFGKADRIDDSAGRIRIIDYKTGSFDDQPVAYYTGRRLQLELYLLAASADGAQPAGAFYFPAADEFTGEKDSAGKYRMKGFFCNDPDVIADMDTTCGGGKSEFFDGARSEKGLSREDFDAFLHYGVLVAEGAEREMRAGNVRPSPYEGACKFCALKGMCAFSGTSRTEGNIKCKEIAAIVRKEEEQ